MKQKYKWILLQYDFDEKQRDIIVTVFDSYQLSRKYIKKLEDSFKDDYDYLMQGFRDYIELRKVEYYD